MSDTHERLIQAEQPIGAGFKDIIRFRELFLFLIWKDLLVRYKQTVVGVGWSIIRPILSTLAFTIVFGKLAKLPSNGIPYPILVFSGLLSWQLFANGLTQSTESIVANANLVTKVYFPRIILPAVPIIIALIDFLVPFSIFIIFTIIYRVIPSWHMIFLPLFIIATTLLSFGIGLWLSAINVKYRDIRYVVPFFLQFALYISPVGFSSSIVPARWRLLYGLNPMVGMINGFRWSLTGEQSLMWEELALSITVLVLLLITGIWRFKAVERFFPDNI